MKKKIIITAIVLIVVVGAAAGGIFGYNVYQSNNLVADVVSVSSINWGYWGDETSSYGRLTNDLSQDIYLDEEQEVAEIFVEDGQTVAIGDALVAFDITEAELELEMKQLELQEIENNIAATQRELTELRNTKPIPETPAQQDPEPEPEPAPEPEEKPLVEKTKGAYNYISKSAKPYDDTDDGSADKPFRFLCNKEAFVYGSYLNYLRKNKYTAVFEIRKDNKKKGTLISSWTVNGAAMDKVDDDSRWSVLDRQEIEEEPQEEPIEEEPFEEEPFEEEEGYTAAELAAEIREKEKELKDLDLDKREAELELKSYEAACKDGTIYATINGVVKMGGSSEDSYYEGTEMSFASEDILLSVVGAEGLYVTGDISELMLDEIAIGQVIYATSWDSGRTFEATITEISEYPEANSDFYGEGNPNVSYYPYTAYIEDSTGLTNGEYVELSMQTGGGSMNGDNVICIEKAYIRQENGRSYVYVAGEDERLVKRYISTGKTVYGSAVIINGGLSLSDRIAFPYGKTAKEGVKVKETDSMYY